MLDEKEIIETLENLAVDKYISERKLEEKDVEAILNIIVLYRQEKEKNKNKDNILQNIREEFLKYDWKNANPIQTYNQIKSLYESIYCKPYEE